MKMNRLLAVLLASAILLSGCRSASGGIPDTTESSALPPDIPSTSNETPPPQATPIQAYVEVSREGEVSKIPVDMIQGTVGSYTIAMDPEYFTFCPGENIDLFSYESWDGEMGVYYSVSVYDQAETEGFTDSILDQYESLYGSCITEETTLGGHTAKAVYLDGYQEAPYYSRHFYLIDCEGEYYVIEAQFVFEMYEGLYAIMRACFDTFTSTDS